jgi:hypothetical protein
MKSLKWCGIVIAVVLLLGSVAAMGAAAADNSGKGPTDKVVFAEYPKNNPRNPGAGWVSSGGVLSPDYKYSGLHWANPTITYYVNPSKSGVDSDTTIGALKAAFATWDNASGPLGYLYGGQTDSTAGVQDYKNVVSWGDTSQYPNAIAVTIVWYKYNRFNKEIVEVDTLMNSTLAWSYTGPNVSHDLSTSAAPDVDRYTDPTNTGVADTYDIQDIMTHEAGHWIMLGDLYSSRDSLLTMYGYGAAGELTKDTLGYGDELGVERVYGN